MVEVGPFGKVQFVLPGDVIVRQQVLALELGLISSFYEKILLMHHVAHRQHTDGPDKHLVNGIVLALRQRVNLRQFQREGHRQVSIFRYDNVRLCVNAQNRKQRVQVFGFLRVHALRLGKDFTSINCRNDRVW